MLSRVLETIREHQLLAPGARVLCAVSGGPDSTALLDVLARLAARLGLGTLEVASVDHGLRPEARTETAAVARASAVRGLHCTVLALELGPRARHVSLQDAARRARLAALAELAQARGLDRIALGHTADDQAETILFRIVRGTGVAGLAGIPYRRGDLVRPLLDVRRAEVLAYLRRRGLEAHQDPSNADRRFTRSRVRHEWLPFLARENPRIVEALLELGRSARPAGLVPVGAGLPPLSARTARQLARAVNRARGSEELSVPGGVIRVVYGVPSFLPRKTRPVAPAPPDEVTLPGPGRYPWPPEAPHATLDIVAGQGSPTGASFSEALLEAGLRVRAPRPGDRMRPRGGRGRRKLQDLLVDAKVPRAARAHLPVVTARDGTILFVPGLRPSEEGRTTTGPWFHIRVRIEPTFPATIDPQLFGAR